jgi:Rps23 Pro-64 3,4-dihydroxylase Tpa1-like proline 4-hydroxylase
VIDNAISPGALAAINRDWPKDDDPRWRKEDGRHNRKWAMPAGEGAAFRIARALSTPAFCARIAELIGEPSVEGDGGQFGGGLHAIPSTGFLHMHQDFKFHPDGRKRVANLLLYVNPEWSKAWGGALRLSHEGQTREYMPIGGRAVIFRTDRPGIHGHPEPLACPPHVMRRSIAVYYYTSERGTPDKTKYQK